MSPAVQNPPVSPASRFLVSLLTTVALLSPAALTVASGADGAEVDAAYRDAAAYLEGRGCVVGGAYFPEWAVWEETNRDPDIDNATAVRIEPHDRVTDDDLLKLRALRPVFDLYIDHPAIRADGFKILEELNELRQVSVRYEQTYATTVTGGDIAGRVPMDWGDRTIALLAGSKRLVSLEYTGPLTGETLGRFSEHEHLKTLVLRGAYLTEEGVRQIGSLTGLESLSLIDCDVTDEELKGLSGLTNLKYVTLAENPMTGRGLVALAASPRLEWLDLTRCFLHDDAVDALADLRALKFLDLSDNQIGDGALKRLAAGQPRRLTKLLLLGTDLTDEGVKSLASLPNLERAWLDQTRLTGRGLANLRRAKSLRVLTLCYAGLSDDDVDGLTQLEQVEFLHLFGNQITDAAVPDLARMTQLRLLLIGQTAISERGRERLRAALPDCRLQLNSLSSSGYPARRTLLKNDVHPAPLPHDPIASKEAAERP